MEPNEEPSDWKPEEFEVWDESLTLEELCECESWCSLPAALSPMQELRRAWEEIGHYEQPEGEELLDFALALEGIEHAGIRVPLALTTQLVLASPNAFIRRELLCALIPRHASQRGRRAW